MNIGERIRELRKVRKVSQAELAKSIKVSAGNVGDWERGRAKPGADALIELMNYFKISADYLLNGESGEEKLQSSETVYASDTKLKGSLRHTMVEGNSSDNKKGSLDLTDRERNLVLAFRQFDDFDKEMVEDVVGNIFKRLEKINQQMSYTYIPGDEDAAAEEAAEYIVQKHA